KPSSARVSRSWPARSWRRAQPAPDLPPHGPWGLLGQVAAPVGNTLPSPANGFLDAAVAMAFVDPELSGVRPPNSLTWSGTLLAPTTGDYRMAFAAEDPMQLEVDSQRVAVVTVPPAGSAD